MWSSSLRISHCHARHHVAFVSFQCFVFDESRKSDNVPSLPRLDGALARGSSAKSRVAGRDGRWPKPRGGFDWAQSCWSCHAVAVNHHKLASHVMASKRPGLFTNPLWRDGMYVVHLS